jgi:heme/copper-type cytochrome/quinol oxidase subunit 2
MAHAVYELNGQSCSKTMTLRAGDTLSIGAQTVDWMRIFGITEAEISLQEAQAENAAQENKGLRMQLIFIYLAVALVLFLIAFYI